MRRISCYLIRLSLLGLFSAVQGQSVSSQEPFQTSASRILNSSCPTDITTLTDWMLKDLPSYANRVIQRTRKPRQSADLFSYVIIAGKPEFEPLKLSQRQYTPVFPDSSQQVFFTTLERQYSSSQAIATQHYHWLFLTQTASGWRLVMVFTQLGHPNQSQPPSPPKETSNGVIGQAISLWLRDCRAGAIRNTHKLKSGTILIKDRPFFKRKLIIQK